MHETPPVTPVFPERLMRTRLYEQVAQQITGWIATNGLTAGDKLPPERELASRLGVSRATLSQALVALEVVGVVAVRHGDGTVLTDQAGSARITDAIRAFRMLTRGEIRVFPVGERAEALAWAAAET